MKNVTLNQDLEEGTEDAEFKGFPRVQERPLPIAEAIQLCCMEKGPKMNF